MIGAIIGDIVGSPYEGSYLNWVDDKEFPLFANEMARFTDDTVLTVATADAMTQLNEYSFLPANKFAQKYKEYGRKYDGRGYGSGFKLWLESDELTVNPSYANGSMMRCSPIPLLKNESLDDCLYYAEESIKYTHNSPESLRGVKSIVSAMQMALSGKTKLEIKAHVEEYYGHMCSATVEEVRNWGDKRNIRCNITAPQALICFLESTDWESAVRNAVYTKGDTDTIAAIAGGIAEAFYGVDTIPTWAIYAAKNRMPQEFIDTINNFYKLVGNTKYGSKYKNFNI